MVKLKFKSIEDFINYCERYFSQRRERNPDGYKFTHIKTDLSDDGDIAFIYFRSSAKGRVLTLGIRIPAKDVWLCFFPKATHFALTQLPERLEAVNDHNFYINPEKQESSTSLGITKGEKWKKDKGEGQTKIL